MTAACESIPVIVPRQRSCWLSASCAIFVLAAICFGFHLGTAPLAGTEGHRAITAEQMLQNGNYLLPRLYGHLYLMKPPLPYWLIAISERLFGPGEWVWRLPSGLASVLLAAGICGMTALWFDSIAGIAAGVAFIGLIPLWSQDRSADVDAINHLGCVMAALAIIDMSLRTTRISASMFILAAVGTAISFLSKGPAGMPIILGALVGSVVANRDPRPLRRPAIYFSVLLGVLPLVIWVLLAYHAIGRLFFSPDISGAAEAKSRLIITSTKHLPSVLALPFIVLAYGLPASALLAWPFMPHFANNFDAPKRRLVRAIVGCVLVAFVIQMLTGMNNPRYAFLNLPLVCPLVGALVFYWRQNDRIFSPPALRLMALLLCAYCLVAAAMLFIARRIGFHSNPWPYLLAMALLLALGLIAAAAKQNKLLVILTLAAVCSAALMYGLYKSSEEEMRSAKPQAAPLAAHIPRGEPILSWNVLWSQPELFYYAHLHPTVERPLPGTNLPSPIWLVLDDEEWAAWQAKPADASHLSRLLVLHPYKHIAYVCWYSK